MGMLFEGFPLQQDNDRSPCLKQGMSPLLQHATAHQNRNRHQGMPIKNGIPLTCCGLATTMRVCCFSNNTEDREKAFAVHEVYRLTSACWSSPCPTYIALPLL